MCMSERNGASQPGGCWIRPEKRLALYLRDDFRCTYCDRDLHHVAPQDLTLDHIRPLSAGGSNDPTNLITACRSCNCSRRSDSVHHFAGVDGKAILARIHRQTRRSWEKHLALAREILKQKAQGITSG